MYCIISSSIFLLEGFFVHLSVLLATTIFLISVRSQQNITDMGTGFDLCVCCEWSMLMMVVKKGLKINLAIKQDSANISNYGVKTIPLDSNVLLISHPSKVTYYIARLEHKTVFPMHLFSSQKGLALRLSCRLQHTLD